MWSVEHSVSADVPPALVWQRYRDVASWPEWNGAVESVVLERDFAAGTLGTLTPPGQGPLPFRVVSAVENEGYVSETSIADTVTMRVTAGLTPLAGGGTRITHRVELDGPGAPYFARSFGSVLAAGVPQTLKALAERAASGAGRSLRRALLVLTSVDTIPANGRPTGAYMSEVAEAWKVFSIAGYQVDVVSTKGGRPPLEAVDQHDPIQRALLDNARMTRVMAETPTAADVDASRYAVVFVVGGHGAAFDLPEDPKLAELLRDAYEGGSVVAAVCHGPAALLNVTLSDGKHLVAGKRVTAFSNDEERAVGMTAVLPFLLAEALAERGAAYESSPAFIPRVVVDGRLVTGQNPASATAVAEAALTALSSFGPVGETNVGVA